LGLMAKPMLVTLPMVMLLLDSWPLGRLGRTWPRRIVEKMPFLALAAASCLVTYGTQARVGAMGALGSIPWPARVANAVVSYARYLGKALWPRDLVVFYPHPTPIGEHWSGAALLSAGILLA